VRLHVPGPVFVLDAEEEEEWSGSRLPEAPRAWGSIRPPARFDLRFSSMPPRLLLEGRVPRIQQSGLHIEHDGSATVTVDPSTCGPATRLNSTPFTCSRARNWLVVRLKLPGRRRRSARTESHPEFYRSMSATSLSRSNSYSMIRPRNAFHHAHLGRASHRRSTAARASFSAASK
jgi:hypothetical protein